LIQESPTAATTSDPAGNNFTLYPPATELLLPIETFMMPDGVDFPGVVVHPQLVKNQDTTSPADKYL
jgi:hypothetical protein